MEAQLHSRGMVTAAWSVNWVSVCEGLVFSGRRDSLWVSCPSSGKARGTDGKGECVLGRLTLLRGQQIQGNWDPPVELCLGGNRWETGIPPVELCLGGSRGGKLGSLLWNSAQGAVDTGKLCWEPLSLPFGCHS